MSEKGTGFTAESQKPQRKAGENTLFRCVVSARSALVAVTRGSYRMVRHGSLRRARPAIEAGKFSDATFGTVYFFFNHGYAICMSMASQNACEPAASLSVGSLLRDWRRL
jgi:hypothetical protein